MGRRSCLACSSSWFWRLRGQLSNIKISHKLRFVFRIKRLFNFCYACAFGSNEYFLCRFRWKFACRSRRGFGLKRILGFGVSEAPFRLQGQKVWAKNLSYFCARCHFILCNWLIISVLTYEHPTATLLFSKVLSCPYFVQAFRVNISFVVFKLKAKTPRNRSGSLPKKELRCLFGQGEPLSIDLHELFNKSSLGRTLRMVWGNLMICALRTD